MIKINISDCTKFKIFIVNCSSIKIFIPNVTVMKYPFLIAANYIFLFRNFTGVSDVKYSFSEAKNNIFFLSNAVGDIVSFLMVFQLFLMLSIYFQLIHYQNLLIQN